MSISVLKPNTAKKPYLTGNPWAVDIDEQEDEGKKKRVAGSEV
jgi:hypothetical protein